MVDTPPALELTDLRVSIGSARAPAYPVDGVDLKLAPGECLGLVGESGAGKSLTLRGIAGLLPAGARLHDGRVLIGGTDPPPGAIGMVFQEPGSSLNPLMRVGDLVAEGLRARGIARSARQRQVLELLGEAGIREPRRRLRFWPHELSGGLRQRVAIAQALAGEPSVLLCDEPTTALDLAVQQQILELLDRLRAERQLAIIFVSHDLAVIRRIAPTVAVMYGGRIVESGPTGDLLGAPRHPYTARLIACTPRMERATAPLLSIEGSPPEAHSYPSGCRFHPRCSHVRGDCACAPFTLADAGQQRRSACIHWRELEPLLAREIA